LEVVGTPEASVEPADNEVVGMGVDIFGGDLVIHIAIDIGVGIVLGEVGFHPYDGDDGLTRGDEVVGGLGLVVHRGLGLGLGASVIHL
jgi:hypothetical protein